MTEKGFLVLEDGKTFEGQWRSLKDLIGVGEVVFNTSLVGYQEILTDPSYFQQIIVMTAPEQGNYGVLAEENESKKLWGQGFVCLELNSTPVSGRESLLSELKKASCPTLSGVDTRELTLYLRERGTPWGALLTAESGTAAREKALPLIATRKAELDSDWVNIVSTVARQVHRGFAAKGRVAVLDYGAKSNIVRSLQKRFQEVGIFNSRARASEILDWSPDGVMLTNGPGDPASVKEAVSELKNLLGKVSIFGICMGHQLLALALGGSTYKLKFGHRGSNHPVKDLISGEIYMTSQNHGYAVDKDLPSGTRVSQINLYDKTVEGIEAEKVKAWSVQYHPEASPGPHESGVLFDRFAREVIR